MKWLTGENEVTPAEVELFTINGVPLDGVAHVLLHLRDGNEEVEFESEYGACEQDNKGCEGGILEVGQLQLHWAELHAPTNVRVRRRRLESHRLPIRRLDVLPKPRTYTRYHLTTLHQPETFGNFVRQMGAF